MANEVVEKVFSYIASCREPNKISRSNCRTTFGETNGTLQTHRHQPALSRVYLQRQLLPGTFEHALNYLLDHKLDLSFLDAKFNNDLTGTSAYPPAMLLKVILYAYSQGIVSSSAIERACHEHVTFIALTGDTRPHFTTFANFVSSLGNDIARLFAQVLFICHKQGLIGREIFAIDGV